LRLRGIVGMGLGVALEVVFERRDVLISAITSGISHGRRWILAWVLVGIVVLVMVVLVSTT